MSGPTFHEAVEASFDNVAVHMDGADEKALFKPGVEGLHMFLEGCRGDASRSGVCADVVSVEFLKKVFEQKGWPHDLSFNRESLASLIESLGVHDSAEVDLSREICDLVDQIHDRGAAKEFPLLRPTDLPGEDEQSAAEQSLGMVDKLDALKVQSYIDFHKQQYFESSPGDPAIAMKEKIARWALEFYYKHLRDFLVRDSLDVKQFAHRFSGSTFIPLIPPQSIGDEQMKRVAVESLSSLRPAHLESLDINLWSAWDEIAETVKLCDADVYDAFRLFLEEDYFRIVRQTCDAGVSAGAKMPADAIMPFQPLVDPAFGVTSAEADARKALLGRASAIDHEFAVQGVAGQYIDFLNSRTPTQKKILPSEAPPKFAASRYYALLQERVGEAVGGELGPDRDNVRALDSMQALPSCAEPSSGLSGIDMILSGQAFVSTTCLPEALVYKSALAILQASEDGGRCNFQGVLVVCDDNPRDVQYAEGSPRKRKAPSSEGKAADVILVDKTGPISACLWGDIAEDICGVWRQVQERRQQGEAATCVVDLSKVRIQGAAKNSWNGECLTRVRTLTSIENVNGEGGTTLKALPRATSDNCINATFTVPPSDCCVSVFRSLRNKFSPPFRLSVKGKVVDLQSMEMSQGGNAKRVFDIVDNAGVYFTCCAMKHNASSSALQNFQEVVVYFGTGRGPIGNSKGMLYLLKDAMIIPIGQPSLLSAAKTEQLTIQ